MTHQDTMRERFERHRAGSDARQNRVHSVYVLADRPVQWQEHGHDDDAVDQGRDQRAPGDDRDRRPRRCRVHDPIQLNVGPPLPPHMIAYGLTVAANMKSGRLPRRLTYLVGLRPTDTFTQKYASRIMRGPAGPLAEDSALLVERQATWRPAPGPPERPDAVDLLRRIEDWFHLPPERPYTVWAFGSLWDQRPREMTSAADVVAFLQERLWVAEHERAQNTDTNPFAAVGAAGYDDPDSRLVLHFVVEASAAWPRLFAVTDDDDEAPAGQDDDNDDDMDMDAWQREQERQRHESERIRKLLDKAQGMEAERRTPNEWRAYEKEKENKEEAKLTYTEWKREERLREEKRRGKMKDAMREDKKREEKTTETRGTRRVERPDAKSDDRRDGRKTYEAWRKEDQRREEKKREERRRDEKKRHKER